MIKRFILVLATATILILTVTAGACKGTTTTTPTTTTTTKYTTTPATVTFEQKRAGVIVYLRAFDGIDNNFNSVASTVVFPSSVSTAADLISWNAAVTKLLTAMDGAISRLAELTPSPLETSTSTHLVQARSYYQTQRTILKALQDAVAIGDTAGIIQKYNQLAAGNTLESALNRATEQLMLQYNISDSEVSYLNRGK
ncbi:MAG: hypothetical protein NTX46_03640 [Chloroflexi bacterium]|nr:hypothetical protein [Chloroflexota bacterium]